MPQFDRTLLIAAASGFLLAAAFPYPGFYPLAWFALVPLLLVMKKRPFAAGFVCGGSFFAVVLYWLNIVMTTYGGLSLVFSLLAYLFLVSFWRSILPLSAGWFVGWKTSFACPTC